AAVPAGRYNHTCHTPFRLTRLSVAGSLRRKSFLLLKCSGPGSPFSVTAPRSGEGTPVQIRRPTRDADTPSSLQQTPSMRAKLLLALTVGLSTASAFRDDPAKATAADELAGTWVVVSATRNGKPYDEIKGDKILFKDGIVSQKSKNMREGKAAYSLDPAKN